MKSLLMTAKKPFDAAEKTLFDSALRLCIKLNQENIEGAEGFVDATFISLNKENKDAFEQLKPLISLDSINPKFAVKILSLLHEKRMTEALNDINPIKSIESEIIQTVLNNSTEISREQSADLLSYLIENLEYDNSSTEMVSNWSQIAFLACQSRHYRLLESLIAKEGFPTTTIFFEDSSPEKHVLRFVSDFEASFKDFYNSRNKTFIRELNSSTPSNTLLSFFLRGASR